MKNWEKFYIVKDCILIGDCWYYGDREYFDRLREFIYTPKPLQP